jgi:cell division protease FtsH
LRPGRFDRHIHVGLPTPQNCYKILKLYIGKRPIAADVTDAALTKLATQAEGFSGADLEAVINEAAMHAAMHDKNDISHADLQEGFGVIIQNKKIVHEKPPMRKLLEALRPMTSSDTPSDEGAQGPQKLVSKL